MRPKGQITDTEPLEKNEYMLLLMHLAPHWRLLCELLWELGLRIGEALMLTRKDFDLANGGLMITSEKREDHLRVFMPVNRALLIRLYSFAQSHKEEQVFPFSQSGVWRALKAAAVKAGIRKSIHAHSFRHGMGFRLRQAGNDIAVVQRVLRHKQMSSTEHYFKATQSEVDATLRKVNQ